MAQSIQKRKKSESPWDALTAMLPWNWFRQNQDQDISLPVMDENTDDSLITKVDSVKINATHPFIATPIIQPKAAIVVEVPVDTSPKNTIITPTKSIKTPVNSSTAQSSPNSIASTLLRKKKYGFSSIRKQQERQRESIVKSLRSKYIPGFNSIKRKGYTGTLTDYDSLVNYMRQVKEHQRQQSNGSQTVEAPKQVDREPVQTYPSTELDWIKELRLKIDKCLAKYLKLN